MAQAGERWGGAGAGPSTEERDPARTLAEARRILILGRTGSGKTTLARQLAAALDMPHVELDSLLFNEDRSKVPVDVLRERTAAAIAADRWVTDGNKRAVRDLVWPRADTVVWLDYPVVVSFWRLAKRARGRTASTISASRTESAGGHARGGRVGPVVKHLANAAKGVGTALRSHRGQRREFPQMFAMPENAHLAVVRLRSPRATRKWLARVTAASRTGRS